MRMMLREYSLAVMYIIVVISAIGYFMYAVNSDDHGMVVTYNTNMVYANDFYAGTANAGGSSLAEYELNGKLDSIDAVDNTIQGMKKPAFVVESDITKDDYIIPVPTGATQKTYYNYDSALALFSANGKISLNRVVGSNYVNSSLQNDVDIVVTKMIPTYRGVDGAYATEWVVSRDKYGNVMRNSDGTPKMVEQVVYTKEIYNRSNMSDFFIDWDVACRYSVIYRYTQNGIKSEYSAMFANKIRPAEEIYEEVYTEWVNP